MSAETYEWLSKMVRAGFVKTREPWWLKLAIKAGYAPKVYDGPVPMSEMHELLASWEPTVESLYTADMEEIRTHSLIRAADDKSHLGVVGNETSAAIRKGHTFKNWLYGSIMEVIGDEAQVSSTGLLKGRTQAWVQIERPQTSVGPDGIKFSPFVTLSMALDNSLGTQINQNTQMVVCDNTLSVARNQGVAFKKTSNVGSKLGTYRGVLDAIMKGESDFRKVLDELLKDEVKPERFSRFLDAYMPINEDDAPARQTRHERIRQEITQLYKSDNRVEAWQGTAFGVVQAVNTWQQHMSQLRNTGPYEMDDTNLRAMRNYSDRIKPIKGESDDQRTMRILASV